jgi:hypothetical protein
MRRLLFPLVLLVAAVGLRAEEDPPRPASADEIALFREALKNSQQDVEHWAYTETTVIHASKGRARGETVVRFDPSKPYAEQFTPLKVDGKPPSEKQLKEYRKRGEKRGEKVARAAEAVRNPGGQPPQMRIGRDRVTFDPEHPLFVHQEGDRITFEVPVQGRQKDLPVEKLQFLVVVNQPARLVESATLRVRESFRVKLVAKVKAGEARLVFTVVDPKFGPVLTAMTGNFGLSVFFVPLNATISNTRTDWQRVKAYDERLQVKLGPLQLLDF